MSTKINMLYGALITFMAAVFGKYWYLFFGFLVLNIFDYITGVVKAKYFKKTLSSLEGAKGIFKKVFYWLVIGIAFYISFAFVNLGHIINIDLSFVTLFGWFTLASYLVNEIRSILENLIEMQIKVPKFLSYGLEVAEKLIDKKTEREEE